MGPRINFKPSSRLHPSTHSHHERKLRPSRPTAQPARLHGLLHSHDTKPLPRRRLPQLRRLPASRRLQAIIDCTSQVFEGLITLADPSKSWVAKWQRLDGYVRGVYATKVSGQLPDEVIAVMEDEARIKYIPRDGTATEAD